MPKRKPFVPNIAARKAMDENQVDEFKEAFRVFDVDNGGTIDSEEYSSLMSMLGMTNDVELLTEMFVAMDEDEDGELIFEEFITLMATLMHQEENTDEFIEAFDTIDSDGTGRIPLSVVKHILEGIAENVSFDMVDCLLEEIDKDDDGLVSMDDLKRFLALEQFPSKVKFVEGKEELYEEEEVPEQPASLRVTAKVHEV
jgi:Ca2+-binding EF-hand superfamily protein|tara:strand:- start:47 stop:643 length:597 start_codon:yes stop_codon:yes gene_type:complete